jgi:hypothetical protein
MARNNSSKALSHYGIRITHPGSANEAIDETEVTPVANAATVYRITITEYDENNVGTSSNYDYNSSEGDGNLGTIIDGLVSAITSTNVTATNSADTTLNIKPAQPSDPSKVGKPITIAESIVSGAGTMSITKEATVANGDDAGKTAYHLIGRQDKTRRFFSLQNVSSQNVNINWDAAATTSDLRIDASGGYYEPFLVPAGVLNIIATGGALSLIVTVG